MKNNINTLLKQKSEKEIDKIFDKIIDEIYKKYDAYDALDFVKQSYEFETNITKLKNIYNESKIDLENKIILIELLMSFIQNQLIEQIEKEFVKSNMFEISNTKINPEDLFTDIYNIQRVCWDIDYAFEDSTINNWDNVMIYLNKLFDNKKVNFKILDKKIKFENEKLITSIKVKNMKLKQNILWTFELVPMNSFLK